MSVTTIILLTLATIALYFIFGRKNNSSPRLKNDAKRFARLLVSEIKLYESYKIERGIKNNNLYESLRNEIEEARKKYKKRISDAKFERFFDDALIEILAIGDKSKLSIVSTSFNK
jgi:hypothetical protein